MGSVVVAVVVFFFFLLLRISAGWLGQSGMFGNEDRCCLVRIVKISCLDQRRSLFGHLICGQSVTIKLGLIIFNTIHEFED